MLKMFAGADKAVLVAAAFAYPEGFAGKAILHEIKNKKDEIVGYRLGFIWSEKLCLTLPIRQYSPSHKDENLRGAFGLVLEGVDADKNDVHTGHVWLGREFKKEGSMGGLVLSNVPIRPLVAFAKMVALNLKDPETLKEAYECQMVYRVEPRETQGENTIQTFMAIPFEVIPEPLREISLYSQTKPDGTVFFNAESNSYVFGVDGHFYKNEQGGNNRPRNGNVAQVGSGNNRTANKRVLACLQKTIDEAIKQNKWEGLKVTKAQTPRNAIQQMNEEIFSGRAVATSTTTERSQTGVTTEGEEIAFDDVDTSSATAATPATETPIA